jgi:hypothetical protein
MNEKDKFGWEAGTGGGKTPEKRFDELLGFLIMESSKSDKKIAFLKLTGVLGEDEDIEKLTKDQITSKFNEAVVKCKGDRKLRSTVLQAKLNSK